MLTLVVAIVLLACGVAAVRWRWGVAAALLVGLLADPLRKMVPGTPAYLAMATLPVWLVAIGSALVSREIRVRSFFDRFPRLARWSLAFGLYLAVPAVLSATYGRNSWQITLLGATMSAGIFFAMVLGWGYSSPGAKPAGILLLYAAAAAVLMAGGPLDYFQWGERFQAVGTQAMGLVWVTHRTGEAVLMRSGFFRGPDIMGWHAGLLTMISVLMALRSRGGTRVLWIALAVWGVFNLWICGRRKMMALLPVFGGCLVLMVFLFRGSRRLVPALGILLLILGLGWLGATRAYETRAIDTFYLTAIEELDEQILRHGVESVAWTVRQAGFWGYGLGMSQQGIHHIRAEKPRLWQESGPSKIVAELGVPGALLFLGLGYVMMRTVLAVARRPSDPREFVLSAGLFSILASNLLSTVVSAQIFGDPLISMLLAFLAGLTLSGARDGGGREAG